MRFPLFIAAALFAGVFVAGCALPGPSRSSTALQGAYPDGTPKYRIELDSLGRRHGLERWWHANGNPWLESGWRYGQRHGYQRAWYVDGTPWYEGRDVFGVPVDTLRYWYPNGRLRSLSAFAGGKPVSARFFDSVPPPRAQVEDLMHAEQEAVRKRDSLRASEGAAGALAEWVQRVRASVETYWSLPENLKKIPRRATARLTVGADGTLLGVDWPEKSGSQEYDRLAARALAKVGRLPPLPPGVSAPLELRYAFATPGYGLKRKKLQIREPDKALGE